MRIKAGVDERHNSPLIVRDNRQKFYIERNASSWRASGVSRTVFIGQPLVWD
jgi:hypothetical protein